ncbi:hypothetical protein ACFYY5_29495 [Nocardia elegans]|uniref:Uncharacterized protein n=1 Tax=Nocardia elegans TaxID=300029 RepID=A0ABW6TLH3_9NOCA
MRSHLRGGPAWGVLVAAIVVYEAASPADELLTAACHRALIKHPVATRAAILITAAHLLSLIPERIDPFTQLAHFSKGLTT